MDRLAPTDASGQSEDQEKRANAQAQATPLVDRSAPKGAGSGAVPDRERQAAQVLPFHLQGSHPSVHPQREGGELAHFQFDHLGASLDVQYRRRDLKGNHPHFQWRGDLLPGDPR